MQRLQPILFSMYQRRSHTGFAQKSKPNLYICADGVFRGPGERQSVQVLAHGVQCGHPTARFGVTRRRQFRV